MAWSPPQSARSVDPGGTSSDLPSQARTPIWAPVVPCAAPAFRTLEPRTLSTVDKGHNLS